MKTVNERSQFAAVQEHFALLENFLHSVVSPQETLLKEAMRQYAQTLQANDLQNAA